MIIGFSGHKNPVYVVPCSEGEKQDGYVNVIMPMELDARAGGGGRRGDNPRTFKMLGGFIGVDFSGGKVRTVTVRRGLKGTEVRKASSTGGLGSGDTSAFLKRRNFSRDQSRYRNLLLPASSQGSQVSFLRFKEAQGGFPLRA